MLGGEAPADAPAAPAALADAVFQPRPAGDPHAEAVVQQRRMLVGSQGADATHQWLEARGIAAAPNSGATSMDCLIISLLQHATSRYDAASEPALAREAARYRTALALQHPEILSGDRMLYADEPVTGALIKMINETQQVSLQLQMVLPTDDGPSSCQARRPGTTRSASCCSATISRRCTRRTAIRIGQRMRSARMPARATRRTADGGSRRGSRAMRSASPYRPRPAPHRSGTPPARHRAGRKAEHPTSAPG